MAGISVYPDGDYQHGATWVNANDREMWQRTFSQGTDAMRKQALAAITADPNTPESEIRANLTAGQVSQSGMKTSPTLGRRAERGCYGYDPGHMYDRAPTDFSGTPAGLMPSSTPGPGTGYNGGDERNHHGLC